MFYHQSRAHPLLEASGGRCAPLGGHGPRCLVSCLCGASVATSGVRDLPRDAGLFPLSAGRAWISLAAGPSRPRARGPAAWQGARAGWAQGSPCFPLTQPLLSWLAVNPASRPCPSALSSQTPRGKEIGLSLQPMELPPKYPSCSCELITRQWTKNVAYCISENSPFPGIEKPIGLHQKHGFPISKRPWVSRLWLNWT